MCHLVAGFPTMEDSWEVARIMAEKGSAYIEVQFPFSDPAADGPLIQAACTKSLHNGFTVSKGFDLIKRITDTYSVPVFIMSYSTIAFRNGFQSFIDRARQAGASGLIIPDLLPPDDEGLYAIAGQNNMPVIPVFPVTVMKERLEIIRKLDTEYMYIALRRGITGRKTIIDSDQTGFLKSLAGNGVKLLAGFGIRDREQVEAIAPFVDAAIIGSELVRVIGDAGAQYKEALAAKLEDLIGFDQ